ncbi:MAG: hypothetical protein IJT87_13265 [Ruminiclostridium sp.]|nr:hypothetical protein [Ruminiclostridium sp.]
MQILNYDLYDLYALFDYFRGNAGKFPIYRSAVEKIVEYITAPPSGNGIETNTVRKLLRPVYEEDEKKLVWISVDNEYTANVSVIKNTAYYTILAALLKEMLDCGDDADRLYDFCDAVTNVPLILADDNKPKKAIKEMIKDYQKKYDRGFLLSEIKDI